MTTKTRHKLGWLTLAIFLGLLTIGEIWLSFYLIHDLNPYQNWQAVPAVLTAFVFFFTLLICTVGAATKFDSFYD